MTRATTLLAAVLFVSAVYATAELVHHAGLNPFDHAEIKGEG